MRKQKWILGFVAGVLFAAAPAARAQEDSAGGRVPAEFHELKGDTYLGAQVGYDFIGDTHFKCRCNTRQSDFLMLGGRAGHFFTNNLAGELTINWIDNEPGFWEGSLGALWDFTPTQHGWNTYVGAGGGTQRYHISKGVGEGLAYLAVGSEYRFDRLLGARFELRGEHLFGEPYFGGSSHNDVQPNAGVLFHFGAPVPPPPPPPPPPAAPPAPPEAATPAPAPPPPVIAPPPAPKTETTTVPFDRGSSRLNNIAKAQLDRVAQQLKNDLNSTVMITGYADATTPEHLRERLAAERAEAVKRYLMDRHQIDPGRITLRTEPASTENAGKAAVTITSSQPQ